MELCLAVGILKKKLCLETSPGGNELVRGGNRMANSAIHANLMETISFAEGGNMRWLQIFRRVNSMDAQAARALMEGLDGTEFNLIDVRQPGEYQKAHLPGAMLIPMADLEARSTELDPELPTLVY